MIFFLYGEDTYRSRQKLKELKTAFVAKHDQGGLNITHLDGEKLDIEKFRNAVSGSSFLASKRLIIVENFLSKNKGQKVFEEINDYLYANKELPKDNSLIFWESESFAKKKFIAKKDKKSTPKKNPLLGNLLKEKYFRAFDLLTNAKVVNWIQRKINPPAGEKKINISADALQALIAYIGNDLWQLNQDLEKLMAYCQGRDIAVNDVELLVKAKFNDNVFHLADAIGQKNKKLALRLLSDQLNSGNSFDEMFPMIIRQFRILLQIKEKVDNGFPTTHLASELNLHSFVVQKALVQALRYKLPQLKKIYGQLLDIDRQRKTGLNRPEILLDLLIATA
ncbi:MAG: DNA polymerase III subunit delta [bacterium]